MQLRAFDFKKAKTSAFHFIESVSTAFENMTKEITEHIEQDDDILFNATVGVMVSICISMVTVDPNSRAVIAVVSQKTGISIDTFSLILLMGILFAVMNRNRFLRLLGKSTYVVLCALIWRYSVEANYSSHFAVLYSGYAIILVIHAIKRKR